MGDWLDSADWWEVDTFIVGFSFGVVGVEFDYWEWVMGKGAETKGFLKQKMGK